MKLALQPQPRDQLANKRGQDVLLPHPVLNLLCQNQMRGHCLQSNNIADQRMLS
jgi:hypothetical protein